MPDDRNKSLKGIGLVAAVIAVLLVVFGIWQRSTATRNLTAVAADASIPTVEVVTPKRGGTDDGLTLPGVVQAYNSAPIYARTNGYVRKWLVDIGDNVRAGQPLAILDAPEVDQQAAAAQADYQTALANQKLARSTSERWKVLLAKDAVSRQEADEKAGAYAASSAVANAALANVKRLGALQGFTRLTAPFAGTVTSRSAQVGALVSSGSASATPLFTVADVRKMRVYVRVPQGFSSQVKVGQHATMTLPEYPKRSFDAVLTRTSGSVDAQSGSVLVELQANNPDRALKPGAYAQVAFPLGSDAGSLHIPGGALISNDAGTQVAVVDAAGKVTLKPVTVGRDEGKTVEIVSGLSGNESVIDTPPDAIADGDRVKAVRAES